MKLLKSLFLSGLLFISACSRDRLEVDVRSIKAPVAIKRFEQSFFGTDTAAFPRKMEHIKKEYPLFFSGNPQAAFWIAQQRNPELRALFEESEALFSTITKEEQALEEALRHYRYYFPEQETPQVYTYISGLDFDYPVIFSDTVLFIALDLYLGGKHAAYKSLPEYLARKRDRKYLVRDCMEKMAEAWVKKDATDHTLLADMIFFGKILYFIDAMMPAANDAIKIEYTQDHLDFCQRNEAPIWAYFIENKLLFSTEQSVKRRFINTAPFSKFYLEFDSQSPGQIGQWVGWQIVRSYMQHHSNVSLNDLMKETDAKKILKNSKYKPKG